MIYQMDDHLPLKGRDQGYLTICLHFGTASLTLERLNELNKKYIKNDINYNSAGKWWN